MSDDADRAALRQAVTVGLRRLLRAEVGVKRASQKTGIPLQTLHNFVADKPTQPTAADLILIALATGRTIGQIVGEPYLGLEAEAAAEPVQGVPLVDAVRVAQLAITAAAGGGRVPIETEEAAVLFPRSILERIQVRARDAALLQARGDSMEPTIRDGEFLLINRAETEVVDGRIYVFSVGDEISVKRLRKMATAWQVTSDNPSMKVEEIPRDADIRIYGRVRWTERAL